jgi:hypothetical protein
LSQEQLKVMRAIERCRTEALGGHVDVCNQCAHERPAYNSCRNRHCPKCQGLAQAKWIEERMERILPTHYFHIVFTLPHELRSLAMQNRKAIYGLLFETATKTLLTLGKDEDRLGAQLGITAVLHTWTRDLQFHPHLHCIVSGGGLSNTADRWIASKQSYLFPVQVLSRLFRGRFVDGLARMYDKKKLEFRGACAELSDREAFLRLKDTLYTKEWVVFAKRPFAGAEQVYQYLGRYTHRVAISNWRLLSIDDDGICFSTRGEETATLHPHEFIRRFLMHVLPKRFVKIRHYGLLAASNATTRLEIARELLADSETSSPIQDSCEDQEGTGDPDWQAAFKELTGVDLSLCPKCQHGRMVRYSLADFKRHPAAHRPRHPRYGIARSRTAWKRLRRDRNTSNHHHDAILRHESRCYRAFSSTALALTPPSVTRSAPISA